MRLSFSGSNKSIINIKGALIVLGVMLLAGIAFSVVQITIASPAAPNPGHSWNQLGDFPLNCSSGQYVSGATASNWVCGTPAGTNYWTQILSGTTYNLYPTGTDDVVVIIGDSTVPYADPGGGKSRLSINAGLGTGTPSYTAITAKGQLVGASFENIDIWGNPEGATAHLAYQSGSYLYGIYAWGNDVGGYFLDSTSSIYGQIGAGSYSLYGNGLIAGSAKPFIIDHPTKPGMKLLHSAIEGPEYAVFYRGESQLINGKAEVYLPDYFEALVREENRTVLLTPKFEEEGEVISQLAASSVVNGKFMVRATDDNNPNQKFYWEVKAVRSDLPILEIEQPAENFPEPPK